MKINLTVLSMLSVAVVLAACSGNEGNAEEVTPAGQAAVSEFKTVDPKIIPLEDVQASQSGSVSQTIATTQMTITYDRPVARGRELFGGIVAFGEIWSPGANDATKVSVSHPGPFQPLRCGQWSLTEPPMCITNRIQVRNTKSFA